MFTGIIESLGTIQEVLKEGSNLTFLISSSISRELKPDQSVSHNGVCLTVTGIKGESYSVTAVDETLRRSNLGRLKRGDEVNLERAMILGERLDGHIVQGHIDATAQFISSENKEGSVMLTFAVDPQWSKYVVEKGSICLNGISLTIASIADGTFSVAIIPYTLEHTNLRLLQPGDEVNIEFDVIAKYVEKMMAR